MQKIKESPKCFTRPFNKAFFSYNFCALWKYLNINIYLYNNLYAIFQRRAEDRRSYFFNAKIHKESDCIFILLKIQVHNCIYTIMSIG